MFLILDVQLLKKNINDDNETDHEAPPSGRTSSSELSIVTGAMHPSDDDEESLKDFAVDEMETRSMLERDNDGMGESFWCFSNDEGLGFPNLWNVCTSTPCMCMEMYGRTHLGQMISVSKTGTGQSLEVTAFGCSTGGANISPASSSSLALNVVSWPFSTKDTYQRQ